MSDFINEMDKEPILLQAFGMMEGRYSCEPRQNRVYLAAPHPRMSVIPGVFKDIGLLRSGRAVFEYQGRKDRDLRIFHLVDIIKDYSEVQDALTQQQQSFIKLIEEQKRKVYCTLDEDGQPIEAETMGDHMNAVYNQALDDLLTALSSTEEEKTE